MAIKVQYSNSPIVPAPLYNISQSIKRTGDGTPISVEWSITLQGTVLPHRGSPNSSGVFSDTNSDESFSSSSERANAILKKKNAILKLFQDDGNLFEIITEEGSFVKCWPRVESVSFAEGVDVDKSPYTITLVAHELLGTIDTEGLEYPSGISLKYNLETLAESFTLSMSHDYDEDGNEMPFFMVSHSVSAKSHKTFNANDATLPGPHSAGNQGYINARSAVQDLMELKGLSSSGHLYSLITSSEYFDSGGSESIGDYSVADSVVSENGDYYEGTYGSSRAFKLLKKISGSGIGSTKYPVRHEYSVECSKNRPKSDATSLGYENIYSISGTIQGFPIQSSNGEFTSAYSNALSYYKDSIQAKGASYDNIIDLILSTVDEGAIGGGGTDSRLDSNNNWAVPLSKTVAHNKRSGSITYRFSFKENPASGSPSADKYFADFTLKVSDKHDTEKTAIIPILGRENGPIIQDLGTTGEYKRAITGSFILKNTGGVLEGGQPWKWTDLNEIRLAAMDVIKKNPAQLFGTGDEYYVDDWTDGLDIFGGTYDINLSIIFVREKSDTPQPPTGGGWWLPSGSS